MELKGRNSLWSMDDSLAELSMLAETAGAQVISRVGQYLDRPTSYYVGPGKLEEIKSLLEKKDCSIAIFDDELTPNQQKNLEGALQVKVIDRTALILDIFSRHAKTREGQMQVELAQHQFLLPRLVGQWSHLERLGGGIGTRGPGETQLETDRRLIPQRIKRLETQLQEVKRRRESYMGRRKQARLPVVALVGYTNAGKSTLLNSLSDAGVVAQDQLFSTLDPVTRRVWLSGGHQVLITDTVGFIHKLPPTVVAAFRATLEELQEADLLVHVVNITHPRAPEQTEIVENTLAELGLDCKPTILAINKIDLLDSAPGEDDISMFPVPEGRPSALVSAARGWNLVVLLDIIQDQLSGQRLLRPWASTLHQIS
ncbi:MAG: GTPase HflX [Dehalococcoidia bacterium]|nr:GTPase HflX [Dehalococcoidia bacterium]